MSDEDTETRLLIAPRIIKPVYPKIRLEPSRTETEYQAPSGKYLSPAAVAVSIFWQRAARTYTAKRPF